MTEVFIQVGIVRVVVVLIRLGPWRGWYLVRPWDLVVPYLGAVRSSLCRLRLDHGHGLRLHAPAVGSRIHSGGWSQGSRILSYEPGS